MKATILAMSSSPGLPPETAPAPTTGADWIAAFRIYVGAVGLGNLVWEFAQLPLYTIWQTSAPGALVFAVLHCTGGDILIALTSLMLALALVGNVAWPDCHFRRVAALTMVFGVSYTIFSEWLNITVRQTWAYTDSMPVVPGLGVGLLPILQWLVIPLAAMRLARRWSRSAAGVDGSASRIKPSRT